MDYTSSMDEDLSGGMSEAARKTLIRATQSVLKLGWVSFWTQLTLSVVSAVILLFSVAFTSQSGPKASLYLTLLGILAGFLSTFWNFGYTRTGEAIHTHNQQHFIATISPLAAHL